MTYLNAKKYVSSAPEPIGESSTNIIRLLEHLGDIQYQRMKYLRLAGSNGKTVCAEMLRAVLRRGGYVVGCLRMPLREEPRDNICIGDSPISMDEFSEHVSTLKGLTLDFTPTKAELLLAVALLAFRRAGCEICIIESDHFGDDPSILLPPPFAAVICGAIPNEDAAQTARIRAYIRRGIQEIVSAPQNSSAYRLISDTCYSINCRLTLPSRTAIEVLRLGFRGTEFRYKGADYTLNMCGRFQISNAVLVLETVEMLARRGFPISNDAVRAALSSLKIPSKFEVVFISPLMIVDSTHTPVAIRTVCDSLSDFEQTANKSVHLCLPQGDILNDYISVLSSLNYKIARVMTVGTQPKDDVNGVPIAVYKTPKALATAALRELSRDDLFMVSGSYPFVTPIRYQLLAILGF